MPHGAKTGLVGRSGGGKTTLTRLLLRMTDIDAGLILIGAKLWQHQSGGFFDDSAAHSPDLR